VLLDAGAGPHWRYREPTTGLTIGRSEGLALASFDLFASGALSSAPDHPLRADGEMLAQLADDRLRSAFQASDGNPLLNLGGRAALMRRLGSLVTANPGIFGRADSPRPGGLFDYLASLAADGRIAAPTILAELLRHFGPIWPSRLTLGGVPLGDCWRHPSLVASDATDGLVPLHKLSQWLAYSLIEPLQASGIEVIEIDGLTGLAEYRNGGLFVDLGVLALSDPADAERAHPVEDPLVVGWRAMTVALLDRLAPMVRERLGVDADAFPLARMLQGGSWGAGRKIAGLRRADGGPPLRVISDGTVF
jgi:hypothetical protein